MIDRTLVKTGVALSLFLLLVMVTNSFTALLILFIIWGIATVFYL